MRVPVVAVVLCLTPAIAFPQSLGDAARQQARKRTTEAPAPLPVRAYGDQDLRPHEDEPGPGPAVAAEAQAAAADTDSPLPVVSAEDAAREALDRETAGRKQREHYWRLVCGEARARLASAQHEHDSVCGPGVLVLTGG